MDERVVDRSIHWRLPEPMLHTAVHICAAALGYVGD